MLKTNLLKLRECEEIIKCRDDIFYFCNNYLFELRDYQERLFNHIRRNDYVIFSKFREGGFSIQVLVYALWRSLFYNNQKTVVLYPYAHNSTYSLNSGMKLKNYFDLLNLNDKLPKWLSGSSYIGIEEISELSQNKFTKLLKARIQRIFQDTDSTVDFCYLDSKLYESINYVLNESSYDEITVIVDEASFFAYPLETGDLSKCLNFFEELDKPKKFIVFSTLKQEDDFYEMLIKSKNGKSKFSIYNCDIKEFRKDFDYMSLPNYWMDYEQKLEPPGKYRSIFDDFEPPLYQDFLMHNIN